MGDKKLQLLMSSVHLTDQGPWIDRLTRVHALGLQGTEIFGEGIISGDLTEDSNIEIIKNTASRLGLTLTAHPWFDWTEMDIDEAVSHTRQLLQRYSRLGVEKINFHLNFFADLTTGPARVAEIFKPLLKVIEENSQKLYFENVPDYLDNPLGSQPDEFAEFFNLIGSHPNVNLNIDIGHAHICHNFDKFVKVLGHKWKYTHIADNGGSSDDHLGAGMGSADWHEIIKAASSIGYSGPFILEFPEKYLTNSGPVLKSAFMENGWQWPEVTF